MSTTPWGLGSVHNKSPCIRLIFAYNSDMTRQGRQRPVFPRHAEICPQCRILISVSEIRRVDREYGLCPYCGCIYPVEVVCVMQLSAPQPRRHKILMSFRYWSAWDVIFFDTDRMRTALPRKARFATDEAMIEFTRRAGGTKTLEEPNILAMMMQKKSGEITLELTGEQYDKLRRR
jgi:hypothetical protein